MMRIMRTRLGKGLHLGVGMVMLFVQLAFLGQAGLAAAVYVGPPATIGVTASPSTVSADGLSTATITATVYDVYGNPVPYTTLKFSTNLGTLGQPQILGASVHRGTRLPATPATAGRSTAPVDLRSAALTHPVPSLAASSSGSTAGPFWTDQNGQAQDTISSTQTGTATITVTAENGVVGTVQVDFVSATESITIAPAVVPADGVSAAMVTAEVYSLGGAPLTGVPVSFSTSIGTLRQATVATGSNGEASDALTSTQAGSAAVTASAGGLQRSATVLFTPPANRIELAVSPNDVPADGVSAATVTVGMYSSQAVPVPNVLVHFNSSVGQMAQDTVLTDASGQATDRLTSTGAGTIDLTVLAPNAVPDHGQATFITPQPASIILTASPSSVPADNLSTATVTATVYDAQGNPAPGVSVNLPGTFVKGRWCFNSNITCETASTTNIDGQVHATIPAQGTTGGEVVTAYSGGIASNNVYVEFTPPQNTITLNVSSHTVVDYVGKATVSAVVYRYGLPVPGATLDFSSDCGQVYPGQTTTNSEGDAQATVDSGPTYYVPSVCTVWALSPDAGQAVTNINFTDHVIKVSASPESVAANGTATSTITATVYGAYMNSDGQGYLAPTGATLIFDTTLGTLTNNMGSTNGLGMATDTISSKQAGLATVTASSPDFSATGTAQINFLPVGAVGETVAVTAVPGSVPADGESISTVTALVKTAGAPVAGVPVTFTTTLGTLGTPETQVTNAQGEASVAVHSSVVGRAQVTARVSGSVYGIATVDFQPVSTGTLLFTSVPGQAAASVWGKELPADNCAGGGCGSAAGQALPWTFVGVSFAVNQPTVAGDVYITGDAAADYSILVTPTGQGLGSIRASGSFSPGSNKIIDLNSLIPAAEAVPGYTVTISLVASGATYGVGSIYVHSVGSARISGLAPVGSAAVQLGSVTGIVGSTVSVPLTLTAAPQPVVSWTVGATDAVSYNSAIIQFAGVTGGIGVSVQSGATATSDSTFSLDDSAGATAGAELGTIQFTCLAPGQSQVSMSGAQYTTTAGWASSGTAPTAVGQVSCVAPTTPMGISGFTPNAVPEVTPGAGASFNMTVTGWGLNSAQAITLVSQTGSSNVTGVVYSKAAGGGDLGVTFSQVPLGTYAVQVIGSDGNTVSGATYFVVAPGIPLFTVTERAPWYTTLGEVASYEWSVNNQGLVPGVDLILLHFPVGVSAVPAPGLKVSDLGNGLDLAAVPVQPGATVTFEFQELLPPSQIQLPGTNPTSGGANIHLGSLLYTAFGQVGSFTAAQWRAVSGSTGWQMAQTSMDDTISTDLQFTTEISSSGNGGEYLSRLSQMLPGFATPTGILMQDGQYAGNMPADSAAATAFNLPTQYSNAIWNGILSGTSSFLFLEGYSYGFYGSMDQKSWVPFQATDSYTTESAFNAGATFGQLSAAALAQPSGDPSPGADLGNIIDLLRQYFDAEDPALKILMPPGIVELESQLNGIMSQAQQSANSQITGPEESVSTTEVGQSAYGLYCVTVGQCYWYDWYYSQPQVSSVSQEIAMIDGAVANVASAANSLENAAAQAQVNLGQAMQSDDGNYSSDFDNDDSMVDFDVSRANAEVPLVVERSEIIAEIAANDSINSINSFGLWGLRMTVFGTNDPAGLVAEARAASKQLQAIPPPKIDGTMDPLGVGISGRLAAAQEDAMVEQYLANAESLAASIQSGENSLGSSLLSDSSMGLNASNSGVYDQQLANLLTDEAYMKQYIADAWTLAEESGAGSPGLVNWLGMYNGAGNIVNQWWDNLVSTTMAQTLETYFNSLMEDPGTGVYGSMDPNFIAAAPLGMGHGNYIPVGVPMYVQVHFENSPKANAPAQNVRVDVQLGRNFDPNSVKLIPDGTGLTPLISVTSSGLVRFYFNNINLPLDTNPPNGEGMVEFQVLPNGNLPDNGPLTVSGNVYFDSNPPVTTQTLTYHIDATTPTTTMAPLPTQSPAGFPVSWSGSDAGGPGIGDYTVLVSVNGGPYSDWMQGTTVTSAVYDGQPGDSYSFIVQAQDLLGQTQPMPSQAQASTTVASAGGGGGGGAPVATATAGTGVGPNGGTVTAGNGALTLDVPPGAFPNQIGITAQPLSSAQAYAPPGKAFAGASLQWSISAGGVQPAKPVLAIFRYDASALSGLNPLRLGIYGYDPNTSAWQWVGGRVYASAGTVSAELNQFGTYAVFANTTGFSDLSQAGWARNAVDTLLGADLVAGVGPGVFDPNADLTRAQFTTLLVKADGLAPAASGATPFADVAATAWYAPYVAAAYKAGLVAGVSPTGFDPNGDLTREQMAVMLAKLLGSSAPSGNLGRFTDASSIAPWAQSGVAAAVGAGLMSGYPGGAFQPTGISSRAQAAAVLAQYLAYVGKV